MTLSWLNVQETAFVLAKLGQPASFIAEKINFLTEFVPVSYGATVFERASRLAELIGFKDFNDCLHTAIGEQDCTTIYTCNYKDFKRMHRTLP